MSAPTSPRTHFHQARQSLDDVPAGTRRQACGLHAFIGTKAQYIKLAPLLRSLQELGVVYNLIDSGQHAGFTPELRRSLGVKEPDVSLASKGNIATVPQVVMWFARHALSALFRPGKVRREIFRSTGGICVIHGDTPSTLLALLLAKRAGLRVAHIEAGLRSFNLLRPFPEELVRLICMRYSDYLFAPSDWAFDNLSALGVRGRALNVRQNTSVEAVYHALSLDAGAGLVPNEPFCLVTIHRFETLYARQRLVFVTDLVHELAREMLVCFVVHDPTKLRLERYGLLGKLEADERVRTFDLLLHAEFLSLVSRAELVITDGGSIQEECAYLDVPCLVVRAETERPEGLGATARLCNFDRAAAREFCRCYRTLKRGGRVENLRPSQVILETLLAEIGAEHLPASIPACGTGVAS